jgi:hypothetical protein
MNRVLLLFLFTLKLSILNGQTNKFYLSSTSFRTVFYVDLEENQATVFKLGKWMDNAGEGYGIIFSDTIIKQTDSSNLLFQGKKTQLQRINGKLYLIENLNKKPKRIEVDTVGNTDLLNSKLNNAYWWDNFFRLSNEINSEFALYHYSFRNGFRLWQSFNNKLNPYTNFKTFTDRKIKLLRDSISIIQNYYTELTNNLISNISTIDYPLLKESLSKLPVDYKPESWYFGTVINAVCNTRPELFFKLAEDMSGQKDKIFRIVEYDKGTIKRLKEADTNSPLKAEFFKWKRDDKLLTVKMMTIPTALCGLLIYLLIK